MRIPVATVVGMVADGMSAPEIPRGVSRPRGGRRQRGPPLRGRGGPGTGATAAAGGMRCLVDQCLPPDVALALAVAGHDADAEKPQPRRSDGNRQGGQGSADRRRGRTTRPRRGRPRGVGAWSAPPMATVAV
ncbi:MAG: hypothetical protein ACRD1K_17040 [Acidimicrobiales bacterium]